MSKHKLSSKSKRIFFELHEDLQIILSHVLNVIDYSILCGRRGQQDQNTAFELGYSNLKYPNSKHNIEPAEAVDIQPYPSPNAINFYYLAGVVKGVAYTLKMNGIIKSTIRWGGDWDSDNDFKDQKLNDLYHFELIRE